MLLEAHDTQRVSSRRVESGAEAREGAEGLGAEEAEEAEAEEEEAEEDGAKAPPSRSSPHLWPQLLPHYHWDKHLGRGEKGVVRKGGRGE